MFYFIMLVNTDKHFLNTGFLGKPKIKKCEMYFSSEEEIIQYKIEILGKILKASHVLTKFIRFTFTIDLTYGCAIYSQITQMY